MGKINDKMIKYCFNNGQIAKIQGCRIAAVSGDCLRLSLVSPRPLAVLRSQVLASVETKLGNAAAQHSTRHLVHRLEAIRWWPGHCLGSWLWTALVWTESSEYFYVFQLAESIQKDGLIVDTDGYCSYPMLPSMKIFPAFTDTASDNFCNNGQTWINN